MVDRFIRWKKCWRDYFLSGEWTGLFSPTLTSDYCRSDRYNVPSGKRVQGWENGNKSSGREGLKISQPVGRMLVDELTYKHPEMRRVAVFCWKSQVCNCIWSESFSSVDIGRRGSKMAASGWPSPIYVTNASHLSFFTGLWWWAPIRVSTTHMSLPQCDQRRRRRFY